MRNRLGRRWDRVSSFTGPFVVASLVAYFLLDWTVKASPDRRNGPFDDLAGGHLRRAGRARPDRDERRQAADERHVRHRHGTAIALSAIFIKPNVWFPVFLVVSVALMFALAEDRTAVLPPLRRPRDRARDQARLRLPVRADGAGRCLERSRRPSRLHPRPGDEPPLRRAPKRAAAPARGRLRLPDPVLLHQGRPQRFARGGVREHRHPRRVVAAKMLPKLGFIFPWPAAPSRGTRPSPRC